MYNGQPLPVVYVLPDLGGIKVGFSTIICEQLSLGISFIFLPKNKQNHNLIHLSINGIYPHKIPCQ